jgi:secernin
MCDTFARTGPHGTLFAKNSDRPRDEVQVVRWYPPRPAGRSLHTQYLSIADAPTHGVMLSQPTWLWGAEHGVNEHGVAIGNERVWADRPLDAPPALIGMDLVRLGLERGATADEAMEVITGLLEDHGQGGSCNRTTDDPYDSSFLIADAHGGWVVETFGHQWVATPIGAGTSISNRYSLETRWSHSSAGVATGTSTRDWHDRRVDTRGADHRLAATRACVATDAALDPTVAIAALRDHGSGPWGAPGSKGPAVPPPTEPGEDRSGITVCMHGEQISTTTGSMVTMLPTDPDAPIRAWVCIGSPCVGEYVAVTLPDVPSALADEAGWHHAAARRDRVEAEPGALAEIRATIAPLEALTFG